MSPFRSRRISHGLYVLSVAIAGLLMVALSPNPSVAGELPGLAAGFGGGVGGLLDQESMGGAPRSAEMGRVSASACWLDLGYLFPSHLTLGLRAHYLQVPLGDGGNVGKLDLLPVTLFFGYRHGARTGRLRGFVTVGAGMGSARFLPPDGASPWEGPDGGEIELSEKTPPVFEVSAGIDVSLSADFSLEVGLLSTFMDTEVSYQLAKSGDDDEFVPEEAYRVKGRHLMLTLGIRWWVELW
jgi:hypothetical protein